MTALLKPPTWNRDLAPGRAEIAWIWPGFLAEGNLTLLTGGWKSGKTTLLALLLDRRHARLKGGAGCQPAAESGRLATCPTLSESEDADEVAQVGLLLNRPVRPGATMVISEEDETLWRRRQRRLDFGPDVGFWCRPFSGRPTLERWRALLDELVGLHESRNVDLVVIDPLAMFLPGNENHPGSLLGPLGDLQLLTQSGLAVLLLHHPAKREPPLGQAARGTGALSACADILLELRVPKGDAVTRRRRIFGFSRYHETPHRLSVELDAEGTEYAVFADTSDDESFTQAMNLVFYVLGHATAPLTRQDILASWPANFAPPEPTTLWRWLKRATGCGLLTCTGTGNRGDAYRYWAAARRAG